MKCAFIGDVYYNSHSTGSRALWLKLRIFMKSTRLERSILFGAGLCLDWSKTRVIRSFSVEKKSIPPTLHSSLLHTLLQTLPFPRFINSIKPLLGSPVVMGRSVWVAVVTDNFYHTFTAKNSCSVRRRKVSFMRVHRGRKKMYHCKGWSIVPIVVKGINGL